MTYNKSRLVGLREQQAGFLYFFPELIGEIFGPSAQTFTYGCFLAARSVLPEMDETIELPFLFQIVATRIWRRLWRD